MMTHGLQSGANKHNLEISTVTSDLWSFLSGRFKNRVYLSYLVVEWLETYMTT